MTKACFRCGRIKALSDFYRHPAMSDGHLGKCKDCTKTDVQKHRAENLERVRAYDRERGRTDDRKKLNRERARKPENRKKYAVAKKAWQERNKDKRACHVITGNAIKGGRLVKQPCEICGEVRVDAHHDDYAYPLDVRWLCRIHHAELHRKYKDE